MLARLLPYLTSSPTFGVRRAGLLIAGLVLLLGTFSNAGIDGDGTEYVMMAHGFYRHATPEISPLDIADIMALPEAVAARTGLSRALLASLPEMLEEGLPLYAGFARSTHGGIQAIHFWMYSLLAAPFYALTVLLGLKPALAFVALNILVLVITAMRIARWFPATGLAGTVFVIMLGPVFYLRWTGPEVFSACLALLATLAMLRRDTALAIALAGFAATQNPAIAGLIPAAGLYHGLLVLRPAWALWPRVQAGSLRNTALAGAGILLAALPFLYNQWMFGVPSIIAAHFTEPGLVSWRRFSSFFLDLNQGMVVGLPGLLFGIVLLAAWLTGPFRKHWLACAAGAACLTCGMAFPALSTVNWNSGYVGVLRYAYWAAMPLVAVCLIGLDRLPANRRRALVAGVVVCQALTMWQSGWPRGYGYSNHTRLATTVLDHAPSLYNPDPEIFFEREMHLERDMPRDSVIVHHGAGGPTKIMRSWSNVHASAGICAPGQVILSSGSDAGRGWRYLNAPFVCGAPPASSIGWLVGTAGGDRPAPLGGGWSQVEPTGVWSDGARSVLTIALPAGRDVRRLALDGTYLVPGGKTDVTINGIDLGRIALGAGPIPIPPAAQRSAALEVVLTHPHPATPASLGMSEDYRQLSFYLQRIYLDNDEQR